MLYRPSNSVTERLKGLFKKRIGDGEIAYLGDSLLPGARVDVPGRPGYVYVRFPYGRDANRNTLFTPPTMARSSGAAYLNYPGAAVVVAVKYNNELEIVSAHYQSLDAAGINTATLNPLNQQSKFVYPWQLTMGDALAVATARIASTLVMVKSFRHYTGGLFFQTFETPLAADKIDLASYIPTTDMHCYACVWIDTYLNVAVVTTSVAQALNVALDATDLNELIVRTASSRPPDGIPLKAFYLSNDQSTITQNALDVDVRQWLNTPHIWGFPNVLTTLERIWANRTLVTGPFTTSGVGALDTGESGALHIIVHKNNLDATTAPTVIDDSGDGYSVGSAWYNKTTGLLYIAADVTVGAAVWNTVTGSGGMSSFTVSGDSGTPQTISDGNTLLISGGTGLSSVASATDILTINLDNTAVTPGAYTYMSGTVDAQGRLTSASSGATPAPADAHYVVTQAETGLSNEFNLGGLTSGLLKQAVAAGVSTPAIAAAGTDYTTPTGTENLSNKTVTGSTIDSTPIGTTARALGYFSALREYIGGFAAIFTHANSADRTYTFPDTSGTVALTTDISSPPFVDSTALVKGSSDATKLLRFEVDGNTTGVTRVLTPPNYDGTIATLAGIETQANKTFTSPVINTGVSGSAIIDDATFASPSSTTVPTTNAVKDFVAQTVLGLNAKADVRLATAAALPAVVYANGVSGVGATLTAVSIGVLTIDGVTVALNDRLLIKDQVAGLQNGIYKCTVAGAIGVAFVLTRSTDGDTDSELRGGWMISTEGTVNATQAWVNTNTSAITFGTTAITFGEFSAGVIAAGTGLTKSGNTISLITPVTIANGGTNATTKTDAFDSLAPTTTQGDMIYHDGTDNVRLPKGTALQYLRMNAGATAEEWASLAAVKSLTIDWQYFSSSGTWTKPSGAILVEVICVGGGGGGGGGRRGALATNRCGGGGGAAGGVTRMQYAASQLGSTETITVGAAGGGGAEPGLNSTDGSPGGVGGNSFFGGTTALNSKLMATGGNPGAGGTATTGTGGIGQTSLSTTFQFFGSNGANASVGGGTSASVGAWSPGGGGGAGGIDSSNSAANGGAGADADGAAYRTAQTGGGGAGGTTVSGAGSNGAAGITDGTSPFLFGAGGGGGAPDTTIGRAGGIGGTPGGGGGGASGTLNGNTGGNGGSGAAGAIFVITYVFA